MLAASNKYRVHVLPNDGQWLRESLLGPAAKPRVKIVHFADHGSASLGIRMVGQDALGPRSLTKQDLVQSLARCHARLDCIVLDMCNSSTYAEAIMLEPRSARYVIHWDTVEVGSQVSKAFASLFYKNLCEQSGESPDYRSAFDEALIDLYMP